MRYIKFIAFFAVLFFTFNSVSGQNRIDPTSQIRGESQLRPGYFLVTNGNGFLEYQKVSDYTGNSDTLLLNPRYSGTDLIFDNYFEGNQVGTATVDLADLDDVVTVSDGISSYSSNLLDLVNGFTVDGTNQTVKIGGVMTENIRFEGGNTRNFQMMDINNWNVTGDGLFSIQKTGTNNWLEIRNVDGLSRFLGVDLELHADDYNSIQGTVTAIKGADSLKLSVGAMGEMLFETEKVQMNNPVSGRFIQGIDDNGTVEFGGYSFPLDASGASVGDRLVWNGSSMEFAPGNGAQTLTLLGNNLTISGGNTVSLSAINTDNQTVGLSGTTLSISGGNSIDISSVDTDDQTLAFDNGTGVLSISGGNSVTLPNGSGGDNWGSQVVDVGDGMEGDGTSMAPLEVKISTLPNNSVSIASDGGVFATGGGGAFVQIYKSGDAWIRADATGVSFSKSGGIGTLSIPAGVHVFAVSIEGNSSELSGGNFTVRIDNDPSVGWNTSSSNWFAPTFDIINTTAQLGGGPNTNAAYIYDEGSTPQRQVTALGGGDIDLRALNLSSFSNWNITIRL